ncbi:MAG TPA: hypothetical protein VIF10_15170 [Methylobacter sp.]|jgi:hypothetical protein
MILIQVIFTIFTLSLSVLLPPAFSLQTLFIAKKPKAPFIRLNAAKRIRECKLLY